MTATPENNQNSVPSGDQNHAPDSAAPNQSTPPPGVDPQAWAKYQQELAIYNQQMAAYQQQMAQQAAKYGSLPPPPPGNSAPATASPVPGASGQPTPVPSASPQPASAPASAAQPTPVPAASAPAAAAQPAPVPATSSQPTPVVKRPRSRRRPRFVEKPKKKDDSLVARQSLLSASKPPDGKHQFSRERKVAGNLPDWDPTPPGEIRISRHGR